MDIMICLIVLSLPDVFQDFTKMCVEIYELDLGRFFSAPGLAMQRVLKNLK